MPLRYRSCLCVLMASLCWPAQASARLQPFEAHYAVSYHGIPAASAIHRLSCTQEQTHTQRCTLSTSTKALLSMIPYRYEEQSLFLHNHRGFQVLSFEYHHKEYKKEKVLQIYFDWKKERIEELKAQPVAQNSWPPLKKGTLDKITQILQLQDDLQKNPQQESFAYSIADDHQIKEILFQKIAEERLENPLWGPIETVVFEYVSPKGRSTRFWFAKEQGFFPVRFLQYRQGKVTMQADLTAYH